MKYLSLAFCGIFTLFAYWQINDPDPILWIPIYGLMVYVSWGAYRGKANIELLCITALMCLAGGLNSWWGITAWEGIMPDGLAMKTVNQELAREALGLGICGAVAALYALVYKAR